MKRIIAILLAAVMCLALVACGPAASNPTQTPSKAPSNQSQTPGNSSTPSQGGNDLSALAGEYNIVMWVSETAGVADQFKEQVAAFCAANPGIVINATIEGVSESESATQMVTSVEDGADLFCFAQDQTARLVMAGAVNKPGTATSETIRTINDAGAVGAATVAGELVAYPLTSDNGYFMYYDKSVITDPSHLTSLEALITDCENAGRNFSFEMETSAWYMASFFFATGCHSNWTMDSDGNFTSVDDDFNSDAGVIALKGMQKLVQSTCYNSSSNGADFGAGTPSAIVVTGTWALDAVKSAIGDNMAAAPLPSFTVDGKTYHLGSYSGNKLMGVKPQTDAKKAAVLQQLALYLTGEECQIQRFEKFGWGPSNLNAQQLPAIKENMVLNALNEQNQYATAQGQIHGSWWDIAKVVATGAKEAATGDEAALKATLANYEATIKALFSMTDEQKNAMSVIGSLCNTNWDTDLAMTSLGNGVWQSAPLELKAGNEFKCRMGASWDVNFGADGSLNGPNVVVEADGTYIIQLTVNAEKTQGIIELLPQ